LRGDAAFQIPVGFNGQEYGDFNPSLGYDDGLPSFPGTIDELARLSGKVADGMYLRNPKKHAHIRVWIWLW